jgi:hypothetical protein
VEEVEEVVEVVVEEAVDVVEEEALIAASSLL